MGPLRLTSDDILRQIRNLRSAAPSEDVNLVDAYRQAAAVLAAIDDVGKLRPIGGRSQPHVAERVLKRDLVKAPGRRLGGRLMLQHDVRQAALRSLGSRERIRAALEINPHERSGPMQRQFEAYLLGHAAPIDEQSLEQLEETLQVLLWLQGVIDGLPDIEAVRKRIAWIRFMAPFETLAGDDIFRGRVKELDALRGFVGVVTPATLATQVRERVNRALDWSGDEARPALSLSGPGGVGKSALISRFILEHSRVPSVARVPFAYLDLDRAMLNVAEPATLIDEMLRQMSLQFSDIAEFERMRHPPSEMPVEKRLANLLGVLKQHLGPRPYIVILDTFEQVQYRGERQAFSLWRMLASLQRQWSFLRVVISGRAPVSTLTLADEPPRQLEIGDLDEESAVAFVRAAGVTSQEMAEAVVRQVGRVPLSLKLAAELFRREPEADLQVKSRFWLRTADEVIQGQLYDRILARIENPDVQRVAHPGLVLRRITPELLLEVLREPCQLSISNLAEATDLFDAMRAEVSLVSSDDPEGALVHRRDLREVMLKLLKSRDPALAAEISERAVKYYQRDSTDRARIERTYHELMLEHRVEKAVFDDPDLSASIQASIADLPVESQQKLASYGFQVDEKILKKASTERRESKFAEEIEGLLSQGDEGLAAAAGQLSSLGTPKHDSPLWRAHARVQFENGQVFRAAEAIENGLRLAIEAGSSLRVLELVTDKSWQCEAAERQTELRETLPVLADYAGRHNDAAAKLQHWLQAVRNRGGGSGDVAGAGTVNVERLYTALRPRELFGLLPATRDTWQVVASRIPATVVAQLILHPDSVFTRARFDSRPAQDANERVVTAAYEVESSGQWLRLAEELERLAAAWPYRNIHVYPPQTFHSTVAV